MPSHIALKQARGWRRKSGKSGGGGLQLGEIGFTPGRKSVMSSGTGLSHEDT